MIANNPASIIWDLAGRPPVDGCSLENGVCWTCGQKINRGMLLVDWQGSNFTDQNKCRVPGSDRICEPCVWAFSWACPPGHALPAAGKKGVNLRLFTHLFDDRGYLYRNKADKSAIRDWLRGPKSGAWFAAIADTGQKHVLPWTPLNVRGGRLVRFEERNVLLGDWALVDRVTELLGLGVSKSEIDSGNYAPARWRACADTLLAFEREWEHSRGNGWWVLALWLSQR